MPELASALHDATGVRAHPNAIGKFLRKLGYTHKKSRWLPPNAAEPRKGSSAKTGSSTAFRLCQPNPNALSSLTKPR